MANSSAGLQGWKTVLGGFLIHLVLGTLYCWANITSAVTSRIRSFEPAVTYSDSLSVYGAELVSQGCTMLLGGLLTQRLGARRCCMLGAALLVVATLGSSAAHTSLGSMVLCQGVLFGMGIGLSYTAPIWASVQWMPHRKGLVTGIIVAGFGFGAFVFGLIATHIVNPNQVSVASEGKDKGYFPADSEVVNNVPKMYQSLAAIYFCVLCLGCSLISSPPEAERRTKPANGKKEMTTYQSTLTTEEELQSYCENPMSEVIIELAPPSVHGADYLSIDLEGDSEDNFKYEPQYSTTEVALMPLAWHISSCLVATTIGGMYMAGTFKTFGQSYIRNEEFLSTISALASIFNTLGRIWWGFWADKFGPINVLLFVSAMFSLIIITYPQCIVFGEAGFALWTFAIFFFEGANFVLYYPIVFSCFGELYSASNYGMIFSVYSFFAMVNIIAVSHSGMEFSKSAILMGALTFIGFVDLVLLKVHIQRKK